MLELHVFHVLEDLPDRDRWQRAIDDLQLLVVLDKGLVPAGHVGRCSVKLGDQIDSEFEFETRGADAVPTEGLVREAVGSRNGVATLRWRGDPVDSACVMAAAAGLVRAADGVAWLPEENLVLDAEALRREYATCLG